jgi:hypothetical protein
MSGGAVTGLTITSPGSGYGSAPTVTIASPPAASPTTAYVTYWSNDGTSVAGSEPTAAISLPVSKGLFSVGLGDTSLVNNENIPWSVFDNPDLRLRIWFNDGTRGWQILNSEHRLAGPGYNSAAVSTRTLSRIIDEVAVYGLAGSSYRWDDFPTGQAGRNSNIHQPSLMLNWDSSNSSLTTRSLSQSASQLTPLNRTWAINGYCASISGTIGTVTIRQGAQATFDYLDGSSSAAVNIPNSGPLSANPYTVANPSPAKPVKNVRVAIFQTSGFAENCSITMSPNYATEYPRSVDVILGSSPSGTFALRSYAQGSASAGKDFNSSLRWNIIFSDQSTSTETGIGEPQVIPSGKSPAYVRFSTVPAVLGTGTIDFTKVIVRFVTQ